MSLQTDANTFKQIQSIKHITEHTDRVHTSKDTDFQENPVDMEMERAQIEVRLAPGGLPWTAVSSICRSIFNTDFFKHASGAELTTSMTSVGRNDLECRGRMCGQLLEEMGNYGQLWTVVERCFHPFRFGPGCLTM